MAKTNISIGVIDCMGEEGNIFTLLAIASKIMQSYGFKNEAAEMRKRVTNCGSYNAALDVVAEYVEVEYVNK